MTLSSSKTNRVIFGLAIFGIILSSYLLWQQISLPKIQLCYVNAVVNCDAVIRGPVAKTLGIPTPLFGLAGYISIAIASLLGLKKVVWGVATFGLLFCLRITYIEIVQLRTICPVCLACQLDMLAVWILATLMLKKGSPPVAVGEAKSIN